MSICAAILPLELIDDEVKFTAIYGDVYESSPWVAREAWLKIQDIETPDHDILRQIMRAVVDAADEDRKIALINAHPDLAGRAALAGEVTEFSSREQAGVGLDQCSPEELETFTRLNHEYKTRFSMPFIIAVSGLNRHFILKAFEARLQNGPTSERTEALKQIHRIAQIRLDQFARQGTDTHAQNVPSINESENDG